MRNYVTLLLSLSLLPVSWAGERTHKTFSERPSKRVEKAEIAGKRSKAERKAAHEWARKNGVKIREYNGLKVQELMAVRNGRPIYYSTKNYNAAISTAASSVRTTAPYSVDGSGVTVGIWDGGSVLVTHTEFSGGRVVRSDTSESHFHATHIGGTIGARGADFRAKGMAPNVHITSYDWTDDGAEMTLVAASSPGDSSKLYLSNHSYGYTCGWEKLTSTDWYWYGDGWSSSVQESYFGQYVSEAAQWDDIMYDAPYFLPFKAAGNDRNDNPSTGDFVYYGASSGVAYNSSIHPEGDGIYNAGFDTINPVSTAKNVMTVGAVSKAVSGISRSPSSAGMASFSGWGPADDGRIKPDIVAQGVDVYSCDNDSDTDYLRMDGTSMATPNACGSAALLIDYYDNLFPGQAMRASTLKGLILHTADDLGRPGPDYSFGWGLMDTLAAAALVRDYAGGNILRMTEAVLDSATKRSDTYSLYSSGNDSVKVTLCWTDPAGGSTSTHNLRSSRLVNDLDLKVIGPDGTHYPYTLSYSSPSANATYSGENNVDNVEQVFIETPAIGSYEVQVDFDGSLSGGLQHYSLFIDGSAVDSDLDEIPDFWESLYFASATGAIASADADGDGADNLTEYITGHNPVDSGSVFKIDSYSPLTVGGNPTVLTWEPTAGRIYTIHWTSDLQYIPFENTDVSGDLLYPVNSYTDIVSRAGNAQFYRIDVKLEE